MDTLFFLISIIGLVVITFWAYCNDQRADIAEQNGVLAIKTPDPSADENRATSPDPIVQPPSPGGGLSPAAGRRQRRRFISR